MVFGANTTLTNAMSLLTDIGTSHNQFSYFKQMAKHIDLVANVPVRNVCIILIWSKIKQKVVGWNISRKFNDKA